MTRKAAKVGKILDELLSAGVYSRTTSDSRGELIEHFMERELSSLPRMFTPSVDLVSFIEARATRVADAYLVNHPDYA